MLDLSNLNGEPNFRRVHQAGQRRLYMKASQGTGFVDRKYRERRLAAQRAGFKVGAYHFGEPGTHDPRAEARFFCAQLPRLVPGKDLRPCLDFELGATSAAWAEAFIAEVQRRIGVRPIIYSYGDFLFRSRFKKVPAPLWLASYGRNDGREHPFTVPPPWKGIVAHQYSSRARVAGVPGEVDISHVLNARALEVPVRL